MAITSRRSATIAAIISSNNGTGSNTCLGACSRIRATSAVSDVLAHSSHVRGIGTFENGIERCRATVTLASQIPAETCRAINLGYRDPASIRPQDYADREADGV